MDHLKSNLVEISSNPLKTRSEMQRAVRTLLEPLWAHYSSGNARVNIGFTGANYSRSIAGLEGFARPLWALAPLTAGGGHFDGWERIRSGLVHGSDPGHAEYWGEPANFDQRFVEMAPIALALCLVPGAVWEPLPGVARKALAAYLRVINTRRLWNNNWLYFRVLVNVALARVVGDPDRPRIVTDLERLESFYVGDGWYSDGSVMRRDYYVAFAMHFYALLYAVLARDDDPERCERFRTRAAQFALDFVHWFTAEGAALPYGRSLTYRFAQGAFWGALAFAGVEALPWGVIKGLVLRHLRWWFRQPIFTETGLLTIGYSYPNLMVSEEYNSPSSPYWALKVFMPLALPETHPFWSSAEVALPALPEIVSQPHPRMLICRDRDADHVVALAGGQSVALHPRHVAEKYAKFCYSTYFAFSVPSASLGLAMGAHDSMLALSMEGEYFRVRRESKDVEVTEQAIVSTWHPWPNVEIKTWLVPAGAWHVRVHWIRSGRYLQAAEGGFALDCAGDDHLAQKESWRCEAGLAHASYPSGTSVIRDLSGDREGKVVRAAPNTNLQSPRTVIPTLLSSHQPGNYWLACAVSGFPGHKGLKPAPWPHLTWTLTPTGFKIADRFCPSRYSC